LAPNAGASEPPSNYVTLPEPQATPVLTKFVFKLVKRKARQIVGKTGYTLDDVDDIQQELVLDLLEQLPHYDPDLASYNTFVVRVVDRKVCKMLRHRRMEKRDYRRETGSVYDQMYTGGDQAMQRIEAITEKEHDRRLGISRMPQEERSHLEIDVRMLLEDLPPDLRRAAELLKTMSVNQAADEIGIPRSTFYLNYLEPLRDIFQSEAMDGYLS
jgi:RNA polymerase sigma-70 factor (ECF subfamily)